MIKPDRSVVAIIVIYFPVLEDLRQLLEVTFQQVDSIVVVDNTPQLDHEFLLEYTLNNNLHLIALGDNLGIAYAQNIGIEWAIEQGADFVLLLDQDSAPYIDMVEKLKICITDFSDKQINVAAAGPVTIDKRNGVSSSFTSSHAVPSNYAIYPNATFVDFLISSGCLIKVTSLLELGGKRSNYFIDHVDTEWCYRARSRGAYLVGVLDAKLHHSLGDEVKLLSGRNIPYHSPLRDYYMFRNTIFTLKDAGASTTLNFFLLLRLIKYFFYFIIFVPDRINRIRYMKLGIKHGLLNIDGRLNLDTKVCVSIPKTRLDP